MLRGKKFRLEGDMDDVFINLRRSLDGYVAWCARGKLERLMKLEQWADAVLDRCKQNWARQLQTPGFHAQLPKGFPDLLRQVREAQKHIVFLNDDRAPHGLVLVCKRWYQREMAKYLTDNKIFQVCRTSWDEVVKQAEIFNKKWGFATGAGIVYNYGIWKPKKGRFRSKPRQPGEQQSTSRSVGPPRQPLYEAR